MNPWVFLYLWIGSLVMQLALGVIALRRPPELDGHRRRGSLMLAAVSGVVPLITLLFFLRVFVIGGSSNVAQLAGDDGQDLWSIWFHAWPMLLVANPPSMMLAVVAVLLPPYSRRGWASHFSRGGAVVASACACYVVLKYFPDA